MGKIINENTEIIVNEEINTITFINKTENGDVYTNTFYLRNKTSENSDENDKEKGREELDAEK